MLTARRALPWRLRRRIASVRHGRAWRTLRVRLTRSETRAGVRTRTSRVAWPCLRATRAPAIRVPARHPARQLGEPHAAAAPGRRRHAGRLSHHELAIDVG